MKNENKVLQSKTKARKKKKKTLSLGESEWVDDNNTENIAQFSYDPTEIRFIKRLQFCFGAE